jgi:hypothetical protein
VGAVGWLVWRGDLHKTDSGFRVACHDAGGLWLWASGPRDTKWWPAMPRRCVVSFRREATILCVMCRPMNPVTTKTLDFSQSSRSYYTKKKKKTTTSLLPTYGAYKTPLPSIHPSIGHHQRLSRYLTQKASAIFDYPNLAFLLEKENLLHDW